ncbi:hypothetical protein L2E82_15660 [Cichorium intybus]|uniref:Uncharacterized protein n=1 Tax=Cichorium intybus TaxID=13427 RepID=A0ACB9F3U4_CICIN|nr:hypothetical protein L2E82_15660 [Cichorium intybus]
MCLELLKCFEGLELLHACCDECRRRDCSIGVETFDVPPNGEIMDWGVNGVSESDGIPAFNGGGPFKGKECLKRIQSELEITIEKTLSIASREGASTVKLGSEKWRIVVRM